VADAGFIDDDRSLPGEEVAMSVAIDVTGLRDEQYRFRPSPLAELGSALHAVVEPAHHPAHTAWIQAIADELDEELLARVHAADFLWRTSRADILLPAIAARTLTEELDGWDLLDDETWARSALITSSCGTLEPHNGLPSPLIDEQARVIVRERAAAGGPHRLEFVNAVLADPPAARTRIRRLLDDCADAFFDDIWQQIVGRLSAEAQLRRDQLRAFGVAHAVQSVSPAVSLDPSGNRILVDKLQDRFTSAQGTGLSFLPSFFGHPHLLVVHSQGWAPVIQYPIDVAAIPLRSATLDAVTERLHALDHPIRIRLARSLARGARTTSELADTWQLSAPEVSRHLNRLRQAGLVTATREGRYVYYTLDLGATARLGGDIIDALLR
jgi:DNA-binding transcriptional ArsR family regulator